MKAKGQIILFVLYWLLLLMTFLESMLKWADGGFCGNCTVMSHRQDWYEFALFPAVLHIPYAIALAAKRRRIGGLFCMAPLLGVIILGLWSWLSSGKLLEHGSVFEVVSSLLGRIWWLVFLVSGLSLRPLFLGRIRLRKPWTILSALVHTGAIIGILWYMFESVMFDLAFGEYILRLP